MSVEVLPKGTTHMNLRIPVFGSGTGRVSISRAISTTSSLNLWWAKYYGRVVSNLVAVGNTTYASRVIEIPDSNNVSMNYGDALPYCVS